MKIKEIFYTLQGEGQNWGMPSIFVRLGECNLRCVFCDTDFLTDLKEMTVEEVAAEIVKVGGRCKNITFTGGEPLLQEDELVELMDCLVQQDPGAGWYFAIETNGTIQPKGPFYYLIDWICCSPKVPAKIVLHKANEVKVVYTEVYRKHLAEVFHHFSLGKNDTIFYISPEAPSSNPYAKNQISQLSQYPDRGTIQGLIDYIKENPQWRLNLQTHKILGLR